MSTSLYQPSLIWNPRRRPYLFPEFRPHPYLSNPPNMEGDLDIPTVLHRESLVFDLLDNTNYGIPRKNVYSAHKCVTIGPLQFRLTSSIPTDPLTPVHPGLRLTSGLSRKHIFVYLSAHDYIQQPYRRIGQPVLFFIMKWLRQLWISNIWGKTLAAKK